MKILALLLAMIMLSSCTAVENFRENQGINTENATMQPENTEKEPEATKTPEPLAQTKEPSGELGSIDNKGSGWGFKKNKNAPPEIYQKTKDTLKKHDAFYMDTSGEKVLFLTFDEGYENGYTAQILDTLKELDVPAAFFITGGYLDYEPELVGRMVKEGHIVGNHTQNHPNLHKLSEPEKMKTELKILDDKFYEMFGEHMRYMRPPEGEYSERVLATAKDAGYKTAFWSFAYRDWERDVTRGADYAFNEVTSYIHSGCVILLHAVSKDNADALPKIINYAREMGYEFKSLDELTF